LITPSTPASTCPAPITLYGAGLAGSEAALQLANRGHRVRLFDIKPLRRSEAHHSNQLAEIVCSNSMGSVTETAASGLLKAEMLALDCQLLQIAQQVAVPAGQALAVDREAFSAEVTRRLHAHPNIELVAQEATAIPPEGLTLIATGPLTTPELAQSLAQAMGQKQLFFFDAAAPIVTKESINFDIAFFQDRYGHTREGSTESSYINCPLTKEQYERLYTFLINAEKAPMKDFETTEKASYFESCMPVEVIASRGPKTLAFGPLKPVGLVDPRTNETSYAVVQLRQDNAQGTLYNLVGFQTNLKWGAQKEMMQLIPGLENAEVVRYGVMHRNTYLHSPKVLRPTLQLQSQAHVLVAGQLTGTEGYTESIACGVVAALNLDRLAKGLNPVTLPLDTMMGALLGYITRPEAKAGSFQPINSNWGIMPELPTRIKDKKERALAHRARALASLEHFKMDLGDSGLPQATLLATSVI
jgi:methylenetetrahydrofolate--tRNA-(uracil-5-)-methyltransferase